MTDPRKPGNPPDDPDLPSDENSADPETSPPAPVASPEPPKGPSAADKLVGSRTRKVTNTSRVVKEAVDTVTQQKDKTLMAVGIIVILLVVGLIGYAMINKPHAQPQQVVYNPAFDVSLSSEEQIRAFTSKTSTEVNEINRQLTQLTQMMQGLTDRQDKTEKFVQDSLKGAKEDFEKAAAEKLRSIGELASANGSKNQEQDPRTRAILDGFRQELASMKISPDEARAKAADLLRQAGVSDEVIDNFLAEASQQAGRIAVGDIAEAPATDDEIATLPPWVKPYLPSIHERLGVLAITTGALFPEQTYGDIRELLKAKQNDRSGEITDDLCRNIADIERVRRANLTPEIVDVIPFLITARDQAKIDRSNRVALATLVWGARDRLPQDITPGQMVSIVSVVGRTIGATATPRNADSRFKPLDDSGINFAVAVVTTAVTNAMQLGKNQAEQYDIAGRALGNYLDTSRYIATDDQRRQITLRAMSAALKQQSAPSTVGSEQPTSTTASVAPQPKDAFESLLFLGPVHLNAAQARRSLVYAIPSLMQSNGVDFSGVKGAAAMVTAVQQASHVTETTLPRYLGKPLGGIDFFKDAVPQLIYALHMGQSLSTIPLPVSRDRANEHSREADLVRGAAIGTIYGPFIHDEAKAKAIAPDGTALIENNPPLTPEAVATLSKIPTDRPIAGIVAAMEVVRQGQFAYPADRFQGVEDGITALMGYAHTLHLQVKTQFHSTDQEGNYDETSRVLIPMSVASHDDGRIPVTDLMALVRADLMDYTALFLAEGRVSQNAMETMTPKYAPAMVDEAGGGSALVQTAIQIVPTTVDEIYSSRSPKVTADNIADVVETITEEALPIVENRLVQEVVVSRVIPRIKRAGSLADPDAVAKTIIFAQRRARDLVTPPYTPDRIDNWASIVTDESKEVLSGNAPAAASTNGASNDQPQANPGRNRNSLWPTPVMLPPSGAGQLVGTTTSLLRTKQIVIPADTYGNAHIQTGVDAEIGGRANLPVLLQMDFDWVGPADSHIIMRGCRVSGSANAMAGPQRVSMDLDTLSYVFPDGREINAKIKGYVADNVHGMYGALGSWNWNAENVLPLAVTAGTFQGAADALKANSTTTIVSTGAPITVANQGSVLKQAVYGGVGNGFGIMSDYVNRVLKDVNPSVAVPNGQRVSVVILEPVILNVPEDEFDYLTHTAEGSFSP